MTVRIRNWLATWRWPCVALGTAAALGAGCHAVDLNDAGAAGQPASAVYPGLQPVIAVAQPAPLRAVTPVAVSASPRPALPKRVEPRNDVQPAGGTVAASPTVAPVVHLERGEAAPSAAAPTFENTLDLGIALRLAGVDNPTINLAREQVREALAGQLAARALLLPNLNVGANVRVHRGAFMAGTGFIRKVNIQSVYAGAGAGAAGAGPPAVPGARLFAHLGDAVYEPLAARQRVTARVSDARATSNSILLAVAAAYLELTGAEARLDVLRQGQADVAEIVRRTAAFAAAGQGREADANRAATNASLLRREVRRAEEDVAVASARLCRLLSLDPSVRLRTPGGPVQPVRLVPENTPLDALVATALGARPELAARSAGIAEAQTRVRQEEVRPWVPTVSVGFSAGGYSGGGGQAPSDFSPLKGRTDFDVLAVWSVRNLGFGNRARVRVADAGVGAAVAVFEAATNQVRDEVAEALADAQAADRQIEIANAALSVAEEGFRLEADRIRQGQGLPIETLDSFRQLLDARQELIRAVIAFDVAQFRLLAAVGRNPADGAAVPPGPPEYRRSATSRG